MVTGFSNWTVHSTFSMASTHSTPDGRAKDRFMLWVDAVGGFLVCLGEKVSFGQAIPGTDVDVPLLADLSSRHMSIRRDGGSYLVIPSQTVLVAGRKVDGARTLADGDLIEPARGVKLRFRLPHALSTTARLDLESRHPTQPAVDAVLLMGNSCVLGPAANSHVVCRHWQNEVILFRCNGGLYCRAEVPFVIDGTECRGQGPITTNSHISGENFSLSLEQA